ncbi:outer membrane immunogenic protein [Mesorhizobium soli]|uniref:outer membrane protein n=1 Tax=Pseudaminobacter soli (ex Li et al. 2025) TaxID=1295366 RepID=UPI002473EA85|nr:porin family protein [Mesorhizobium soli]MDH6235235.1 outer membrane immunogenic protein [Mesorhizobium soli]
MRKYIIASALIAASITGAKAADVVVQEPVAIYNWSGVYVGAQIGYAWANARFENSYGDSSDLNPRGFFGGIYGGYNYQFSNDVVIGVDADINAADIRRGSDYYFEGKLNNDRIDASSKVKWTGAVRARLGYAMDRFLPYIAGGYSAAQFEMSLYDAAFNREFSEKTTRNGWNLGVGLDYAATDNLILRAEYRYSDYGRRNSDDFWGDQNESQRIKFRTNDIRLGIAYKF